MGRSSLKCGEGKLESTNSGRAALHIYCRENGVPKNDLNTGYGSSKPPGLSLLTEMEEPGTESVCNLMRKTLSVY